MNIVFLDLRGLETEVYIYTHIKKISAYTDTYIGRYPMLASSQQLNHTHTHIYT